MITGATFLSILEDHFPDVPHTSFRYFSYGFAATLFYKGIEIYVYSEDDLIKIYKRGFDAFKLCYYFSSVEEFELLFSYQFKKFLEIVDKNLLPFRILQEFKAPIKFPNFINGRVIFSMQLNSYLLRVTQTVVNLYTVGPGSRKLFETNAREFDVDIIKTLEELIG